VSREIPCIVNRAVDTFGSPFRQRRLPLERRRDEATDLTIQEFTMYRFYYRRFLNLKGHHGGAYVLAVIETLPGQADDRWGRDVSLELADCSRRVEFDFPLATASDRRNSIRKARLLADVTARFADALEIEAEATAARRSRRDDVDSA
jgi:hypothetical protein